MDQQLNSIKIKNLFNLPYEISFYLLLIISIIFTSLFSFIIAIFLIAPLLFITIKKYKDPNFVDIFIMIRIVFISIISFLYIAYFLERTTNDIGNIIVILSIIFGLYSTYCFYSNYHSYEAIKKLAISKKNKIIDIFFDSMALVFLNCFIILLVQKGFYALDINASLTGILNLIFLVIIEILLLLLDILIGFFGNIGKNNLFCLIFILCIKAVLFGLIVYIYFHNIYKEYKIQIYTYTNITGAIFAIISILKIFYHNYKNE